MPPSYYNSQEYCKTGETEGSYELDWEWDIMNGEMVLIVRKVERKK
jgi:hypothetical protein